MSCFRLLGGEAACLEERCLLLGGDTFLPDLLLLGGEGGGEGEGESDCESLLADDW